MEKIRLVVLLFILMAVSCSFTIVVRKQIHDRFELQTRADEAELQRQKSLVPFVYTLVPTAESVITLPAPGEDTSNDTMVYESLKPDTTTDVEVVRADVALNLPFMSSTYGEYLKILPQSERSKVLQLHDELAHVTKHLNEQFPRPALQARVDDVVVADVELAARLTYPSAIVVDALVAAYIMSKIDPEQSENYNNVSTMLINRGISYGFYSQSDIEASRSVVDQYVALLPAGSFDTLKISLNLNSN